MSTSFASDSENNFIIENGQFVLVDEGAQVVQNVRERLLSYLNDWFLDRSQGVPYFQLIFTKPFDLAQTESILKETIIRTPGVSVLTRFESNFDSTTRGLTITFAFETEFNSVEEVTINV